MLAWSVTFPLRYIVFGTSAGKSMLIKSASMMLYKLPKLRELMLWLSSVMFHAQDCREFVPDQVFREWQDISVPPVPT
jgi:hypothetical protein